jgi:hypothetical protein
MKNQPKRINSHNAFYISIIIGVVANWRFHGIDSYLKTANLPLLVYFIKPFLFVIAFNGLLRLGLL